ncbi:MAG TPA: DNA polymerase III subunit gamma/tau [Bacteroidia bacterium]|nr:DNA polymerase III subunit gamma/tau [Bacteroidia bacterium]
MDGFVVSARKYRPQHFNTVVGQSHITNTLKNAILNKQLAQAYLFCGPRGVGKTTCARIFAKTINCRNLGPDGEACDKCESCVSFNAGTSLNVQELDAASNSSVDGIRNLVDQVRFAPQVGDYKVYIIDEVHMLSMNAFNAFLKTLEEPPRHAKFILATTERHKIIPTILSRCQVFNFNRIRQDDISKYLAFLSQSEHVRFEPEALQLIAQKADGALRDACSIFDQMVSISNRNLSYKVVAENLNVLDYDYYFKVTESLLSGNYPAVMLLLEDILNRGFDAHQFLVGLAEHFRNLLVCKDAQTISLLEVSESLRKRFEEQSKNCDTLFLMRALGLISKSDVNFKMARNQRLLVETTLLQLSFLNSGTELEKKKDEQPLAEDEDSAKQESVQKLYKPEPKVIRRAEKPSIGFEQLRVKAGFSLQEAQKSSARIAVTPTPLNELSEPVLQKIQTPVEVGLEDLKACIAQYAEMKLGQGSRQAATIFRTAEASFENNTLRLKLLNETQKEQVQMIRQEFVDYLRNHTASPGLQFETIVAEQEPSVKAYKPVDIFKAMSVKNPRLLELKKKFDLEIEY